MGYGKIDLGMKPFTLDLSRLPEPSLWEMNSMAHSRTQNGASAVEVSWTSFYLSLSDETQLDVWLFWEMGGYFLISQKR